MIFNILKYLKANDWDIKKKKKTWNQSKNNSFKLINRYIKQNICWKSPWNFFKANALH